MVRYTYKNIQVTECKRIRTKAGSLCHSLFDLILYVPLTIFQLYRDRSSWVEPGEYWREPAAPCSQVKHSTTKPLPSLLCYSSPKKDIEQKQIFLTSIKGYRPVTNKQNMEGSNPNLDLININAFTKFGGILSICSEDNERKQNSDVNQGP